MRNTLDEGRSKNYHLRPLDEMLAQLVEHVTFNHRVAGSIPARLTTISERQAGFSACPILIPLISFKLISYFLFIVYDSSLLNYVFLRIFSFQCLDSTAPIAF